MNTSVFLSFGYVQVRALLIMFILVNYYVVNVGVPIHDPFSFHHVHKFLIFTMFINFFFFVEFIGMFDDLLIFIMFN